MSAAGTDRRVTLLTDFGTADGYVAAMTGVIAAIAPDATLHHAAHDLPQGDILGAALALSRYAFLYPEDTVHLVVVDPGVGTDRRPLAARVAGRSFVAPDNGVLTRVLQPTRTRQAPAEIVAIDPDRLPTTGAATRSATFHGRDIFAPAAALLARSEPLTALGDPVPDPVLLSLPEPARSDDGATGEVIQVDRFGNLITNIPGEWVGGTQEVREIRVAGRPVGPLRRTYADVAPGQLVALIGSLGLLEISVRDGSGARMLRAERGSEVKAISSRATPGRHG